VITPYFLKTHSLLTVKLKNNPAMDPAATPICGYAAPTTVKVTITA
jgi:hypothetical protein